MPVSRYCSIHTLCRVPAVTRCGDPRFARQSCESIDSARWLDTFGVPGFAPDTVQRNIQGAHATSARITSGRDVWKVGLPVGLRMDRNSHGLTVDVVGGIGFAQRLAVQVPDAVSHAA